MLELTGAQKFKTKLAHVTSAEEERHPILSSNHVLAMVFHSFHKGLFFSVFYIQIKYPQHTTTRKIVGLSYK